MIGHLFYLKDSYNFFLHNIQLKVFFSYNLNFVVSFLFPYKALFNRLVQSCPIHYCNSCGLRHGTRLEVLSFNF